MDVAINGLRKNERDLDIVNKPFLGTLDIKEGMEKKQFQLLR